MRKVLFASFISLILGCFLVACDDAASTPVPLPTSTPIPTTADPLVMPSYDEIKAILAGNDEEATTILGTELVNWHGWVVDKYRDRDSPTANHVNVRIEDPFAEELLPAITYEEWEHPEVNPTALAVNAKSKERDKNLVVTLQNLTVEHLNELATGQEIRFGGKVDQLYDESVYGNRSVLSLVDVRFQPEKQATPVMEYPKDVIIGLGRASCYGACPSYSLSINGDGVITYEGRGNVKVCGTQTGQISKADVAELVSLFEKADFFTLRDYEAIHWNDSPYYGLWLTLNGKTHELTHYDGDVTSPIRLHILEDKIDEVTDSMRWVGDSADETYTEWCDGYPVALPTP